MSRGYSLEHRTPVISRRSFLICVSVSLAATKAAVSQSSVQHLHQYAYQASWSTGRRAVYSSHRHLLLLLLLVIILMMMERKSRGPMTSLHRPAERQ